MPVKRISAVSSKDRSTFICHTVSDDLIDWLKRPQPDGTFLDIGSMCHDAETNKIPVKEGYTGNDLIAFTMQALTVDDISWADDQAMAAMNEATDGNEGRRFEALKAYFVFRKSLVRVRNVFEVGDEFEGDRLIDVFVGIDPDIQREVGRVAIRRSHIETADKKKS